MQRICSTGGSSRDAIGCDTISYSEIALAFDSRRLHLLNQETSNDLEKSEESLGVSWERSKDGDCLSETVTVSSFGATLDYIAEHWPSLPPHSREAVLTLIHSASVSRDCEGGLQ